LSSSKAALSVCWLSAVVSELKFNWYMFLWHIALADAALLAATSGAAAHWAEWTPPGVHWC
jgi:hypothetical protein